MRIEKKLEEMGVTLPEIPTNVDWPVIPGVQVGNLLFLTGVSDRLRDAVEGQGWTRLFDRRGLRSGPLVRDSSPRRGQVCSRGPR